MGQPQNVFTKLSKKEAIDAIDSILTYRGDLLLWSKGSSQKEKFRSEDFDVDNMTLFMSPVLASTSLKGKEILLSFESKNLQYFTTGILTFENEKDCFKINIENDFFKCDKRKSFRLASEELDKLTINIKDQVYKGIDISTGGTSFLIFADQPNPFRPKQILENMVITFNQLNFNISKAEVRYVMDQKDYRTDSINKKIGIMFKEISETDEAAIFKEINNAIYKKLKPFKDDI